MSISLKNAKCPQNRTAFPSYLYCQLCNMWGKKCHKQGRTPFQPRCNISSIIFFCQTHISNAIVSEKDQFICDYLHQAETCLPIATRSCCPTLLLIQFHQIPLFHSQQYQLFISTVGLTTNDRNRRNGGTFIPSSAIRNLFRIILCLTTPCIDLIVNLIQIL